MYLIAFIILIALIIAVIAISSSHGGSDGFGWTYVPEHKRYGDYGEKVVTEEISKVLKQDDYLFTNVEISYEGKKTELDNVIVNKYGVFIIEAKNYKGRLYGNEDDYEWEKYKDDDYGNTFVKNVRNPIRQVKRQTYILAKYLQSCGVRVWVEGYAIFLHDNSPVDSDYVLESLEDIDKAIHTFRKNHLSKKDIDTIRFLFYTTDNNS